MSGHIYFEIQADDLKRVMKFYGEIFGWEFEKAEGTPMEYWRINTGGTMGGLHKRPNKVPPPEFGANSFVCSMEVENFDETAQKITNLNGKVVYPKFPVKGVCWQGYFTDSEGNYFGIFQPDDSAA